MRLTHLEVYFVTFVLHIPKPETAPKKLGVFVVAFNILPTSLHKVQPFLLLSFFCMFLLLVARELYCTTPPIPDSVLLLCV